MTNAKSLADRKLRTQEMATPRLYETVRQSLHSIYESRADKETLSFDEIAEAITKALVERGDLRWVSDTGTWLYRDRPDIHPDRLARVLVLPYG